MQILSKNTQPIEDTAEVQRIPGIHHPEAIAGAVWLRYLENGIPPGKPAESQTITSIYYSSRRRRDPLTQRRLPGACYTPKTSSPADSGNSKLARLSSTLLAPERERSSPPRADFAMIIASTVALSIYTPKPLHTEYCSQTSWGQCSLKLPDARLQPWRFFGKMFDVVPKSNVDISRARMLSGRKVRSAVGWQYLCEFQYITIEERRSLTLVDASAGVQPAAFRPPRAPSHRPAVARKAVITALPSFRR